MFYISSILYCISIFCIIVTNQPYGYKMSINLLSYRPVDTLPCVWFVAMHMLRRRCAMVKLCAVIVALPYALLFVYAFTGYSFTQNESFATALSAQADADNYIILVMIDEAFTDMAINFYEASLRAHRVDNFLFVGVGRKTCQRLSRLSIACFYYADDESADRASSFGQREFKRKMNIRTDMILKALSANFTVVHSDTDVAFLGNPLAEIKVIMCNREFRSSPRTIALKRVTLSEAII